MNDTRVNEQDFLQAALELDKEKIAIYVVQGGDIRTKDDNGANILHHLSSAHLQKDASRRSEQLKILRYILDCKSSPDINSVTVNGRTPLLVATTQDNVPLMKLLIEKGANVNAAKVDGTVPLHEAALGSHLGVETLIAKGANIDSVMKNGETPLHWAAGSRHTDALDNLKLLIEKGANVNAACTAGITPLHCAAAVGNQKAVELLIKKGATVKAAMKDGTTALHSAARMGFKGCIDAMILLVEAGAALDSKNAEGKTPLDILESKLKESPEELKKVKEELKQAVRNRIEMSKTEENRAACFRALALLGVGSSEQNSDHGLYSIGRCPDKGEKSY